MPKLTRTDGELQLSLSGAADFQVALAQARSVPGRRYDGDSKLWCFPEDPAIAERLLLSIKPTADASILSWVRASRAEREKELATVLPDDAKLKVPWADRLYDFQRAAVDFMADHPRALLADEMGLGKTAQALSAYAEYRLRYSASLPQPKLVVAPNSAKGVWAREIIKWLGDTEACVLIDANTAAKREAQLVEGIRDNAWCVVNYEMIRAAKHEEKIRTKHRDGSHSERTKVTYPLKQPLFGTTSWGVVVADEAHRAKNRKALVTQGLWQINAPMKLALTGTPIQNAPDEIWSILRWLYPEQYGTSDPPRGSKPGHPRTPYWTFYDQYTDSYEGYGGGKVVVGVKNPDALRFELKDRLLRRTKAEKLSLPGKVREFIPVKLNPGQQKAYNDAERDFWLRIEQAAKDGDEDAEAVLTGKKKVFEISNAAARTVRLRQVCCSPALLGGADDSAKFDAIVENIVDNRHQQHVVFTEFVEGANLLVARLRKKNLTAEAFTGEVSDTRIRTYYEDRFQAGEIDVLVGTIGAMRESITLTAASVVHFSERAWVPAWNEQAEDRLNRVGQDSKVTVLIYEAVDTVDTGKVRPANQRKELIVSSVVKQDEVEEVERA